MNEHTPGIKIAEKLFSRPEGATMAEVVAATGSRPRNLLERLKARGYAIRSQKESRTTRYWASRPESSEYEASVAANGKVTLPKEIRDRLRLYGEVKVSFVVGEDGVLLKRKPVTLDDLYGLLHRPGMRARTIEEINDGIAQAAAESAMRGLKRPKK